jgi:hypothetical protein
VEEPLPVKLNVCVVKLKLKTDPVVGVTTTGETPVIVTLDAGKVTALPPEMDKVFPARDNVGAEEILKFG